ncbi:ABC transporter permease [Geoalkalibacter sp.]|uniref:ABC transporter permease n=1 Tax=Geoalkalibacter sp. TaxID=3041440 RepID=UPI00272EC975|nr:iron export ABC transporter permease subunit FetB [Geoalkalibacter sp.]
MSDAAILDLGLFDLLLAYGLFLLVVGLARLRDVGQERDLIWASLRMVGQLLLVGYLLHWIFAWNRPLPVLVLLALMFGFAVQVIGQRVSRKMPGFYRVLTLALMLGCGLVTFLFCVVIVGPTPWYDPRYLIPLTGMIIGNSMNGATLAAERLSAEMSERRQEIETALCLGASATQASREALRGAFRAALIPATNSMAAMGIVFLPGMMTGQILSGTEPMIAVRYQIGIMFAITGAVGITSFLIVAQGVRRYFTPAHQLRDID